MVISFNTWDTGSIVQTICGGKRLMVTTMGLDLKIRELHWCWNHSFLCQRCLLETMPFINRTNFLHSYKQEPCLYFTLIPNSYVTRFLLNLNYSVNVNQASCVWSFNHAVCFDASASSASYHQVCHLCSNTVMLSTVFQTCSSISLNQVKYSCLHALYISVYLIHFLCPSQNIDFNYMHVLHYYYYPLVVQTL